jgi:hypothetical protein
MPPPTMGKPLIDVARWWECAYTCGEGAEGGVLETSGSPRQALDEMANQQNWYRHTDLPLFGLPDSYVGLRLLGDGERFLEGEVHGATRPSSQAPRRWVLESESYGLAHGDPLSPEGPRLQVTTSRNTLAEPADLLNAEALRPGSALDFGGPRPFTTTVSLDGEEVVFNGIRAPDGWVLQASFEGYAVTAVGVRFPPEGLVLIRILDVEPYISGRREYLRSRHPGVW